MKVKTKWVLTRAVILTILLLILIFLWVINVSAEQLSESKVISINNSQIQINYDKNWIVDQDNSIEIIFENDLNDLNISVDSKIPLFNYSRFDNEVILRFNMSNIKEDNYSIDLSSLVFNESIKISVIKDPNLLIQKTSNDSKEFIIELSIGIAIFLIILIILVALIIDKMKK